MKIIGEKKTHTHNMHASRFSFFLFLFFFHRRIYGLVSISIYQIWKKLTSNGYTVCEKYQTLNSPKLVVDCCLFIRTRATAQSMENVLRVKFLEIIL